MSAHHIPTYVIDRARDWVGWLDARTLGVTGTDIPKLVRGGIQTRRSILADKTPDQRRASLGDRLLERLGRRTRRPLATPRFAGNRHTRRGRAAEPRLADWVALHFGIEANTVLWAHPDNPLYLATPNGLGVTFDGQIAGFEVTSMTGVDGDDLDPEHVDKCQWGMFVTGRDRWLYVWERVADDGTSPREPAHQWIDRDDARIAELRAAADRFIAWRAAGAPTVDPDMTEALDEQISRVLAARAGKAPFERDEKAAVDKVRAMIAADPDAHVTGWDKSGTDGGVLFKVFPRTELDEEQWAELDPKGYATYRMHQARADRHLEGARQKYRMPAPTTRLTISAHKPVKGAAS